MCSYINCRFMKFYKPSCMQKLNIFFLTRRLFKMVTLSALVAFFFNMDIILCGISEENEISGKGDDWYATEAKENVSNFIKNSKTYIEGSKPPEDTSSDSKGFQINKWLIPLNENQKEPNKKHYFNRNFVLEKNEHIMRKSQHKDKKQHAHTRTKEGTKVTKKRRKKYGKDWSQSAEKGKNHNWNRYRNKEKDHNEEKSKKKFYIKERERKKNRDIEKNTKPTKNPANMLEVFRLNENNTSPITNRSKDANKKILHEENNIDTSEVRDKHSKLGSPKNIVRFNKLVTESYLEKVLNKEKKWATPGPSKLRAYKKKHGLELRSTRMPPLALNQLDEVLRKPKKKLVRGNDPTPPDTLSPYAIMAQMKLVMDCFPHANATFETIGRTDEYNDIVLVKISERKRQQQYFRADESKYIDDEPEKKIVFIVHGLSVMGLAYLESLTNMNKLKILMSYYLNHLEKFDVYLIPMANPDGYSFAINYLRSGGITGMWNKNVSPQDACRGVYLDRNFDVAWNITQQKSSCSQLYPGTSPFSEVESIAVRNIFHHFGHKIEAYINVHSGTYDSKAFKGDGILYPKGYMDVQSDDDKYIDLKGEVEECMKNASLQVMSITVDTLYNWYGKISGSSVDYASTVYGIPYSLEFVMQLYDLDLMNFNPEALIDVGYIALTEIWSRLIDTVFTTMWKSQQLSDLQN